MIVTGCGGDSTAPATNLALQAWSLQFNYHAVTLATIAPYDTVTLTATPRTQDGTAIATLNTVFYTTSDTALQVDSSGHVQVHATSTKTNIRVVASIIIGGVHGVTLRDTAYVNIVRQTSVTAIPLVASLSIQPASGDSAARPIDSIYSVVNTEPPSNIASYLPPNVMDVNNHSVASVQVYYFVPKRQHVLTHTRDALGNDIWTAQMPGRVMVHAEALVYGTFVEDSCQYVIGYPAQANISIDTSMATGAPTVRGFPDLRLISLGGSVIWSNQLTGVANDSVDIEFDDPTNIQAVLLIFGDPKFVVQGQALLAFASEVLPDGSGDIAPFPSPPPIPVVDTSVANVYFFIDSVSAHGRSFPVEGTYTYHSKFFPGTGVIKVVANSSLH